jgi:ribonuclease HI
VTSGLVAECLDALSVLANQNELSLMWVPEHCGIPGNEQADKLARRGSAMLLLGPELALGVPRRSAKETVKNLTEWQHHFAWKDLPGHKHDKLFINVQNLKFLEVNQS